MSTSKTGTRYDEDFKRTLVNIYQSVGKTQATLCKEYGVSLTVLTRCIEQYSTDKTDNGNSTNHLYQEFNQKYPVIVWVSNFSYIKVSGKWYYLCIIMDLFFHKVISWNISAKPDVNLVTTALKKAYDKRKWGCKKTPLKEKSLRS